MWQGWLYYSWSTNEVIETQVHLISELFIGDTKLGHLDFRVYSPCGIYTRNLQDSEKLPGYQRIYLKSKKKTGPASKNSVAFT